jgi:hypothetical protein
MSKRLNDTETSTRINKNGEDDVPRKKERKAYIHTRAVLKARGLAAVCRCDAEGGCDL